MIVRLRYRHLDTAIAFCTEGMLMSHATGQVFGFRH